MASEKPTTEAIAPGITGFTSRVRPGAGVHMDTRSLVIELNDGTLLLHSPMVCPDGASTLPPPDADTIDRLGEVRHIVAPNLFHHLGLQAAVERWPRAHVWAPPGLAEKGVDLGQHRSLQTINQPAQAETGQEAAWPSELEAFEIAGMPTFREWVFLHRTTGTLIVTDLLFNRPVGHGLSSRILLRLTGAARTCNVSRLFRALIRDKAAFAQSCKTVLDLPFERLVMAHGEVIERDAKTLAAGALARWAG